MTLTSRFLAAAASAALLAFPAPSQAQSFSPAQRGEIEQIIKDYLLAHPELLEEVSNELDKRKQLAQDPSTVEDILREGAQRARREAQFTMDKVRTATGLQAKR